MKTDLASSIGIAIAGILIAYFTCNLFVGTIEDASVKTVDASFSTSISNPDPEIFNYKAINPTVEVYVGESDDCREYNDKGECIDAGSSAASNNTNQGNQ